MSCSELETALREATENVFQNAAPASYTEYIVWAVYGYTQLIGDDAVVMSVPRVQIDVYSQEDGAELEGGFFEDVRGVLDGLALPYAVPEVGYDPDAAAMRMILQLDVI